MTDFVVTQTNEEYQKFRKARARKEAAQTFWMLTGFVAILGILCYALEHAQ